MREYAVYADYVHIPKYEDADENLIHTIHRYLPKMICCKLVQNLVIRLRLRMLLKKIILLLLSTDAVDAHLCAAMWKYRRKASANSKHLKGEDLPDLIQARRAQRIKQLKATQITSLLKRVQYV